jgi:endogenous inhibitor of DNA gyrase (YacG/DUF329 family)
MNRVRCPICDRWMPGPGPKEWPEWPFCSKRCKTIDLGRWLGESYRIAEPMPQGTDLDGLDDSAKPAAPSAVPDREEAP